MKNSTTQMIRRALCGLVLLAGIAEQAQAINSYYWVSRDWTSGAVYGDYWSYGNSWSASSGGSGLGGSGLTVGGVQSYLNFDGSAAAPANGLYNITNDFNNASGFQIYFKNTVPAAYNLYGNPITFYDISGTDPNLQNEGTTYTPTINFAVTNGNNNGTYRILNLNLNSSPAQGPLTFNGPVAGGAADANSRVINIGGGNITFNNTIANGAGGGTLALTLLGAGTVKLAATNTFTGDLSINAGTGLLATNSAVSASGAIRLGDVSGSTGANLNLNGGNNVSALVNARATTGTKIVANTSGTSGTATFAGNLYLDGDMTSFANSGGITWSGTLLDLKNQTLTVDGAGSTAISGALTNSTGSGKIIKQGAGTLTLNNNANAFSGGVIVKQGVLIQNSAANALGTGTLTLGDTAGANSAILNAAGSGYTATNPITIAAGNTGFIAISNGTGSSMVYSGPVALNTNLTMLQAGSGGLRLSGAITGSVGTTYITNAGTGAGSVTFDTGVITNGTGTVGIVQNSATSTLYLNGQNLYTGGLFINLGTVSCNIAGGLGAINNVVTLGNASGAAATLVVNGASGSNAGNIDQPVTVAGTGVNTISSTWNTSGQINLLRGLVTLSGQNLTINSTGQSGWRVQAGVTGSGNLNLQPNGSGAIDLRTVAVNNTGAITNSGTGTGAVQQGSAISIGANVTSLIQNSTTSPWQVNQANGSFVGTAQVLAGTMRLQNASALSVNNTVSVASGTTLDIQDVSQTLAGLNNVAGSGGTVTDTTDTAIRTLTLGGGSIYSFGGIITATTLADMAITKSGSGTQTLNGANTYAGGTTLSAGQLNLNYGGSSSANSAIGTGAFTINGGTIDNTSAGDVALQPAIAQNWSGDFTYAGSVHNLNLGTGAVTLGANRNVTVSANTLTVGGNISGLFSLTKSGAGNLTLTGANTYTGATTVSAGTLVIGGSSTSNNAALTVGNTAGSIATLTITNATLITGAASYVGSVAGASSNQLTIGMGGLWNVGNQVVRVASGGLVTNNTLLVTDGGLVTNVSVTYMSDNAGSLGNSLIISNNGQFISNDRVIVGQSGGARSQQLMVAAAGKLYTKANDSAIGNVNALGNTATVTGAGSLWDQGGRNLRIGANTSGATPGTNNVLYVTSGGVVSNVGSIYLPDYNAGVANGIVISNGGQFYSGSLTLGQGVGGIANYYYVGGLGASSFATNVSVTVGGNAGTVGNQVVITNATLRSGGTVTVGNNATATNNSITVLAGGILDLAGNALHSAAGISNNLVISGGVVTNVSGNFIWGDSATAFGDTLTISNGGKFYTSGGITEIGRNSGSTSNSIVISGTGSVWDVGTKTMTIGGTSGSATGSVLTVASSGLFTNGSVTVSGNGGTGTGHALVVNGGTVYANTLTVNSGGTVQLTGGTGDLLYADVISGSSSLVITGAATSASSLIAGWNNSSSSVGPLLAGNLALTKNGAGILTLTNANTYAGATIINAGTVSVSSDANLGNAPVSPAAGSLVINNGGTLSASTGFTLAANRGLALGPTSGAGGGTLDVAAGTLTYNGIVANNGGSGMLTKASAGNLLLGGANTYSGGTVISAGTLQLGSNTALGGGGATNTSGATLDLNGAAIANALSIAGTGVGGNGALINNNTGAASTVSNNILGLSFTAGGAGDLVLTKMDQDNSGQFTLTKVGAGTLFLSGTNLNYLMALTVNGGTVVLNKANANTTFDWAVDRALTITSGTLQIGAVGEQIQTDQGVTMNGGAFDLGGFGQSLNFLAGTGGMVTNSGGSAATLTVGSTQFGSTTTSSSFAGVIADGAAKVALTKYGTNVFTLTGVNTYTGNTAINAGTLALSGSASLAGTANLSLAGGAKFDVSALSSTFSFASGQTLIGGSGTGILAGNINLNTGALTLNYTNGTPSLSVTNGTFSFNSNAVTVTVSGLALGAGSYKLITKGTGGNVTGTLPANVTVNGAGAAATANLLLAGGELYLVVPAATTTALVSSANPSGFNDLVAFTANVQTNGVTADDVTGTVTFFTNSVAYVTNGLSSGTTNFSLSVLPRGTNLITAVYSGDLNYLPNTNSLSQVVTNHPPVAANVSYPVAAGVVSLRVAVSNLLATVTDADGDSIALVSLGNSTNGVTPAIAGGLVQYYNTNGVSDQFSYTVSDGFGGTNTAYVSIVVSNALVGQVTGAFTSFTGGVANLTFHGIPDLSYVAERSTNLTDWVDVVTNTAATNGVISVQDYFYDLGGTPPASAYYRLKWQQ